MLTLTRKPNQGFIIDLDSEANPNMTVAELFRDGPIDVVIQAAVGQKISVGIDAPAELKILRDELLGG